MKKNLLEYIACPKCHNALTLNEESHQLICDKDKFAFNIVNGIPVLITEKAKTLSEGKQNEL